MATLRQSLHLPFSSFHPSSNPSKPHLTNLHLPINNPKYPIISLTRTRFILKAAENGAQTDKEQENSAITEQQQSSEEQLSELGTEIKKAMKEREKVEEEDSGFLSGFLGEIGQIEWPDFGKVIGTTGVVLGVIAGSSAVLLSVNAVLAELSDKVFAGKGVQDFFGG
ncbi:preprotein translocase subunit SECE1-like [Chenopodium quinoa]|uniref:Preprotein translocase subunit SECE1 n=1 Tax=Chenopodium quinoa TaxID=63459 RepID=A0A803MQT5_CHEQI|nr:preprotein translocase subunit SECE1-like [Chenopodium quinoa]